MTQTPPAAGRAYHHGDLRAALVRAAEEILGERGLEGFTLREAARRAGVSPAAPAHHFGDARGLLTAVATLAFAELGARLKTAADGPGSPEARLDDQGRAYVGFALERPALFDLMFRTPLLNCDDAVFAATAGAAFQTLSRGVDEALAARGDPPGAPVDAVAAWSLVHGFARLALDGQFDHLGADRTAVVAALVGPVLARLRLSSGP